MSVFMRYTGLSGLPLIMLSLLLGTSASPVFGQETVETQETIDVDQLNREAEQERQMVTKLAERMRTPWPKTGRNVVEALRAEKKYATFLLLAERGGMLSLLNGMTTDTTTPTVVLVPSATQFPWLHLFDIDVDVQTDPSVTIEENGLDMTSIVLDMMQKVLSEAVKKITVEEGKITVFAPTDAAFTKLPKMSLKSLLQDSVSAAALVRSYIVNRGMSRDGLGKVEFATSLTGTGLTISSRACVSTVNDVTIMNSDVIADNGVVYGLATVLPMTTLKSSRTILLAR